MKIQKMLIQCGHEMEFAFVQMKTVHKYGWFLLEEIRILKVWGLWLFAKSLGSQSKNLYLQEVYFIYLFNLYSWPSQPSHSGWLAVLKS